MQNWFAFPAPLQLSPNMGGLYVSRFWFAVDRSQCAWPDFLKLIRNTQYLEDTQGNRAALNLKYQGESPMRSFRNRFSFSILFFCALPLAVAQINLCGDITPAKDACSFTALNGNCTLTIDRLRPVMPPTIYARHGSVITVTVLHPSPFEDLTLDLKSATAIVPTDTFKSVFDALSPTLQKAEIVLLGATPPARVPQTTTTEIEDILKEQNALLAAIMNHAPIMRSQDALALIQKATQAPPGNICLSEKYQPNPWVSFDAWKTKVDQGLDSALTINFSGATNLDAVDKLIATLAGRIDALKQDEATSDKRAILTSNQDKLDAAWEALKPTLLKLQLLKTVVDSYQKQNNSFTNRIVDFQSGNKNDLNEQWTLDYANSLSAKVKSAVADPPKDSNAAALSNLITPPPDKQPVVTVTVLYQTPPRIEVSTGLMVPMLPYHSYASAEAASGGTITGYVVQESKTYTVVPVAQMNIVAKDWVMHQQRAALFGTVAVGYNPATSNVEFGVGPSFSWRSIVLSGLADIGRDTQLAGGFTVGESLGTTSVTPLTSTIWSVKPAIGISVRIPLGGSSK
jgi:hypothetical protein